AHAGRDVPATGRRRAGRRRRSARPCLRAWSGRRPRQRFPLGPLRLARRRPLAGRGRRRGSEAARGRLGSRGERVSSPAPRRKKQKRKRQKQPGGRRSPWAYLAPAALLGAVTVIVLILSSAGVIGHPSDGTAPPSTTPVGTVQTLPVPDTPPPPEPPPPEPPPLPPPAPPAATTAKTTTTTASTTTASTTPSTTTDTTTTETTENDGQHVKWTV